MRWLWFIVCNDGVRMEFLMSEMPCPGVLLWYSKRVESREIRTFGADEVAA